METKYHDIMVAKQFESRQNGQIERKTIWNKVGQAWSTRSAAGFNFELYLLPGQRYFINFREDTEKDSQSTEEATF